MGRKPSCPAAPKAVGSLGAFAYPNPECSQFNRFEAGNLSVFEWTGKHKDIRRLYCSACKRRSSERQGTLLRHVKFRAIWALPHSRWRRSASDPDRP